MNCQMSSKKIMSKDFKDCLKSVNPPPRKFPPSCLPAEIMNLASSRNK